MANLSGVLVPVATPFDSDGRPCARRFVAHCRWLLDQGADGLAVFGTTSEASSLSVAEKRRLLEALLEAGIEGRYLLPGTGSCALPDALELTRAAVGLGARGVLMLPPFYYKAVSEDGLFDFFDAVVDGTASEALRIYLYHIPPVAQVGIGFGLIERLRAKHPATVVGIKDSSGDLAHTLALNRQFPGFEVFAGSESFLLANLRAGGVGCITATGNINVRAIAGLARAWETRADDEPATLATLEEMQAALTRRRTIVEACPVIPAVKSVLAAIHGDPAWRAVRPPLRALPEDTARDLATRLAADGFMR